MIIFFFAPHVLAPADVGSTTRHLSVGTLLGLCAVKIVRTVGHRRCEAVSANRIFENSTGVAL